MNPALAAFILSRPCGFLDSADLQTLVQLDRLCPVLVRCDGGRFTCAAQDAAHFIALIERDDREAVRDVSITTERQAEAKIAHDLHRAQEMLAAALPPRVIPDRVMFAEPAAESATRCGIRFNSDSGLSDGPSAAEADKILGKRHYSEY